MAGKNIATKSNGGIKIVELGTELRVDPRQIVAAAQEMAMENAKVPASWVTAGQADRLRAKFGGQGELKARIERKLRHFESALETPTEAPKVDKVAKAHNEKMGKKMFESDRRNIFGVVANADGVRVEPPVPQSKKHGYAHKSETAGETSTSNEAATSPATEAPAKKFIQVTVAPPIRRDPNAPDPRFGVIVPSTEGAKKDDAPAIWSNLKDGHAPVDFSTTLADDAKAAEKSKHADELAKVEAAPEEKKIASRHSGRKARVEAAHHDAPAAVESAAVAPSITEEPQREEHHRKRQMDVPVKWQPKNKAFGAKVTHKTKVLKKLESQSGDTAPTKSKSEVKEKREHNAAEKQHAPQERSVAHEPKRTSSSERKPAHAQEQQPEGVFSRLIRKIFKK